MKSRYERRSVYLAAAACTMRKADDVGAALLKSELEGEPFGVVDERNESRFVVGVVTHQHGQFAGGLEGSGGARQELTISTQKGIQGRGLGQVARIVGVALLAPIGRVQPGQIKCLRERGRGAGIEPRME